ncbi:MAG: Uma2 family endonuclease [Gemmataceae bacterium]|nr:Uma2 family endonuclease [Gemmataceae bacterium]
MPALRPKTRRWTRREYHRLANLGFFNGRKVQLVLGEIMQMPAMKNPHAIAMGLGDDALRRVFDVNYWIRQQLPLSLGEYGEPEPDFAVVLGKPRDFTEHPKTALLIMEISDTSLDLDRERKGAQYAYAGIEDNWIVNLLDGQLEVYRDPQPNRRSPRKSKYATVIIVRTPDSIALLAMPKKTIAVADLLP